MLLVRTTVGPSGIHGLGVFAAEPVAAGQRLWTHHPTLDRTIPEAEHQALPASARQFLERYAYPSWELDGALVLNGDDARFMNHSAAPNTSFAELDGIAIVAIAAGAEITCDYRQFMPAAWLARLGLPLS